MERNVVGNRFLLLCLGAALGLAALGRDSLSSAAGPAAADVAAEVPERARVAVSEIPLADGLDFPVGPPDAEGYYDAQPFGRNRHLGSDWNGLGGGDTDLGDPVFSVGDGLVTAASDVGGGWGGVVRVVHRLPDPGGGPEWLVESLYAHLEEVLVRRGDSVRRGERLGSMGNVGGLYAAHLHLEIRGWPGLPLGGGYGAPGASYMDPTELIQGHRPPRR